jgi:hypothetical protein
MVASNDAFRAMHSSSLGSESRITSPEKRVFGQQLLTNEKPTPRYQSDLNERIGDDLSLAEKVTVVLDR